MRKNLCNCKKNYWSRLKASKKAKLLCWINRDLAQSSRTWFKNLRSLPYIFTIVSLQKTTLFLKRLYMMKFQSSETRKRVKYLVKQQIPLLSHNICSRMKNKKKKNCMLQASVIASMNCRMLITLLKSDQIYNSYN